MAGLTTYLAILFFTTLPVVPYPSWARGHFTPSALGFPAAMAMIPRSAVSTTTPRSWEVARCVQHLVWAWMVVTCLEAVKRTVQRVKRGSLALPQAEVKPKPTAEEVKAGDKANKTPSPDTNANRTAAAPARSLTPNPVITALILHLISWRLATSLMLPDLPGAWSWPFDATTLIGLGTGLACSWAEVWRILRIVGWASDEAPATPTQRHGWITRILHTALSAHRLLLAVRILSATLDTSGSIKPLPGLHTAA